MEVKMERFDPRMMGYEQNRLIRIHQKIFYKEINRSCICENLGWDQMKVIGLWLTPRAEQREGAREKLWNFAWIDQAEIFILDKEVKEIITTMSKYNTLAQMDFKATGSKDVRIDMHE